MTRPRRITLCLSIFLIGLLSACSSTRFKASADREVYGIISKKGATIPNMDSSFTIEPAIAASLDSLPVNQGVDVALGAAGESEKGAAVLSLEKALDLAVKNNRQYQNQKEVLYLTALNLTLARYRFTPIFGAGASGELVGSTRDVETYPLQAQLARQAPQFIRDIGGLTGTPGDLIDSYATLVESAVRVTGADQPDTKILQERRIEADSNVGVELLLKGGAQIAIGLTSNFLRFLTGDPRVATSSALVGSIRQPLLRGAGSKVTTEALIQAERDLLYELRTFTQFRKEFVVGIASSYYRVLQARDTARNNYRGYESFKRAADRQRALAESGRLTEADTGRSQQAQLSSENNWVSAVRGYREQLDQFKIQLGLSTDSNVVLDEGELNRLREQSIIHPQISGDDAVKVGIVSRLDLYNVEDQVSDADRNVEVAANSLKPGVDLLLTGNVDSEQGDNFNSLDFRRPTWSAGLDAELPLDRKSERNSYRTALINWERAKRNYDLAVDNVKLEVRRAWRQLDQAKRTFEIQEIGVQLNQRRVEEQELLSEAGRATTLDQIDAQNDLIDAQNALTEALVDHTIARLEFWQSMGILFIKEDGNWEEVTDVKPS